ncbi:hypothetical protein OE88DRAFT_1663701 [Heliocybe sulcata]|uniref:Uncharacterized protein n=1 Tax=Heliocybe sulcata TaxID=5364 RepID=A0A5C3MUC4_9AGAM|nr:hypothetical protein OE88DRAFT_1663701 [Heliocybe sulcata]
MVELLTTVQSARRAGKVISHATRHTPSLPVSIPTPRRPAAVPNSSPTRNGGLSDLVFDMSPVRSSSGLILPRRSSSRSRPCRNGLQEARKEASSSRAASAILEDLNLVEVSCVPDKAPTPEALFLYTMPTLPKQPSARRKDAGSQARIESAAPLYSLPSHGRQFRDGDLSEDDFQASSFDSLSGADRSEPREPEVSRHSKSVSHVKITGFVPSSQKINPRPRYSSRGSLRFTPVSAEKACEAVR